jgi:hypothetical protein
MFTILAPCPHGWTANLGQLDAADNTWPSESAALAAMRELESDLGWHDLRVVSIEQLDNMSNMVA